MKREEFDIARRLVTENYGRTDHDNDRLSWLDAHKVYIEVDKVGYIHFNGTAWSAARDGKDIVPCPTLRHAIDVLQETGSPWEGE